MMDNQTPDAPTPPLAVTPLPKPESKALRVNKLLKRTKGATLAEIAEPTGWQPHSTRAYLSRLRTKGITVTREQRKSGETAYRFVAGGTTAAANGIANVTAGSAAQ